MAIVRELITRLGFTIDDAEARRYDRRLENIGKKIRGVGRGLSLFVTAPILALGGAFIKTAADAEETDSKFKEVFKSIREEADATAKSLAKDFDLANTSAQEMLSSTGDILVGFGFTEKAALDLSKQVNSLAVDIASFKNVQGGAAQASNAITKALLGERESLKGLGIAILEEDVKLKVAQLTAEGMTFTTARQAKSFATLQLIIERSTKAIGDYARTSGSATNQSRKLRQRWIELSVTLGKVLLPIFTDAVKALSSFVEWMNSFSPAGRKAIIIIAGIAAALGPLLIVLGSIVTILAAIPVLTLAAVAAVAALGFLIGEDIAAFIEGRDSVVGLLFNAAKSLITRVFEFLTNIFDNWIAANITPWIRRLESLAVAAGLGQQTAATAAGVGSTLARGIINPLGPITEAAAFAARSLQTINQGDINVDMQVTAAPGESAEATGRAAGQAVARFVAEARSRAASSQGMAP